jgi:hypothetical protein
MAAPHSASNLSLVSLTTHKDNVHKPVFSSPIAISANWQPEMYSAFLPGGVRFGMVAEIQNPYLYSKTLLLGL